MMDEELRLSANARGKNERKSSRAALIRQYREPEERCYHLWKDMPKDTYCNFDEDCFCVYCGIEAGLYYFPVAVPVSIRINSCSINVTVADYSIELDILDIFEDGPFVDDGVAMVRVVIFDHVQLEYGLSVTPNNNRVQFTLDLKMCSMIAENCQTPISVFQGLQLQVEGCDKIRVPAEVEFDVLGMTLEHFQRFVDLLGFDESKISKLINNILTIVTTKVIDLISTKLLNDYEKNSKVLISICLDPLISVKRSHSLSMSIYFQSDLYRVSLALELGVRLG
ncbi:uncharacterized protein [Ptychodera flava]|uniref:uncharacterized protein n=1 Tax=Ptychodera flava TaxID=63121 RepID=UPI00396A5078